MNQALPVPVPFPYNRILESEIAELFCKYAVLLEVDSIVTAILHVIPVDADADGYLLIASNQSTPKVLERQEKMKALIQLPTLTEANLKEFFDLCKFYIRSNLHQSIPDTIFAQMSSGIWLFFPSNIESQMIEDFYASCYTFFQRSTDYIRLSYKRNLKSKCKVQNLNFVLFSLQRLVANFITIRYYYHIQQQQCANYDPLSGLKDHIRKIDNTERVFSQHGVTRHAEAIFVDHIFERDLKAANQFQIFPSKKLCLHCHTLLHVFQLNAIPLQFFEASNIGFKNWKSPAELPNIHAYFKSQNVNQVDSGEEIFQKQFLQIKREFEKINIKVIDGKRVKQSVSMFDVPFIMDKYVKNLNI